ncbi:MAG: D-alanyl-D-alanine carboxypeptidase [Rhodospirillales bacterium]
MLSKTRGPTKWVTLLLTGLFALYLLAFLPAAAAAKYASLVIDVETGKVLHATNADTRNYPASLTKMMTLYLVFEAVDTGKLTLDQRFRASARAARQPSSKLGLNQGETMTVREAIMALVTKSANDVASMVAEEIGGTERQFALLMTTKARRLGMSRTTFRNASGLPHRGQMSTARDMAILARRLLTDYPHYYRYFSEMEFTYDGTRYKNHNNLLTRYEGTDGIKTGYIRASGFNLVASVVRNGRRLIGVVFGGRSPKARDSHMMALLNKSFATINHTVLAETTPQPKPQPAGMQQAKSQPTVTQKVAAVSDEQYAAKTPADQPAETSQVTWAIQVGAYSRFAQARAMAQKVIEKFPNLLKDGSVRIDPLKLRRNRPVYRARIVGLEKRQAYRACDQLKRRKIDCMEVLLKDLQVASIGD